MDVMTTLGTIVLAVASVAGLGQLLGDEHKTTFRRAIPKDISGRRPIKSGCINGIQVR